jgi:mono/diheme cytochrome c family protein
MPKRHSKLKMWAGFSVLPLLSIGWVAALNGQAGQSLGDKLSRIFDGGGQSQPCPAQAYNQDAPDLPASTEGMTAKVHDGHRLFRAKCGTCHTLDRQASKSESSPQDWTNMVNRMRDMPSSHMTDAQATIIANYIVWYVDYSNELVKTLMAFDRNGDGKLQKDELPDRWQEIFKRADTNHDGVLTPEEIRKYAEAQAGTAASSRPICDPEQRLKK